MRVMTMAVAVVLGTGLLTGAAAGEVELDVGDAISLRLEDATLREALLEVGKTVPLTLTERGAAPEEVESQVTKRIEEAVNTISGIEDLRSVSAEGLS